jgi:hypothetical protein
MNNFSSNIFSSTSFVLEKTCADDVVCSSLSSTKPDNIFWNIFEETLFSWLINMNNFSSSIFSSTPQFLKILVLQSNELLHSPPYPFRKKQMAEDHYRLSLLRRCFMAWQLFLTLNEAEQELHKGQSQTKSKMAAFLEKAATGKLWSDRPKSESAKISERVVDSAREKVVRITRNGPKNLMFRKYLLCSEKNPSLPSKPVKSDPRSMLFCLAGV